MDETRQRPWPLSVLKWLTIALVGLVALVALAIFALNTGPGKRLVVDQLNGFETATGLGFEVGAIRGSLYGDMTLVDVRVRDTKGVFLTSPALKLDWHPFAFANGHIDVDELSAERLVLRRLPELKPDPNADPNAPLLPDYDIDVDRLTVGQFVLEAPVTGERRIASVDARVAIADRRAQVTANAATLAVAGLKGGDRLALTLDAVPDDDKFNLSARLVAPADGAVAALAGIDKPIEARIAGKGTWTLWSGQLLADVGGERLATLAVQARDGTFRVKGDTRPQLLAQVPAQAASLLKPVTAVDITAALDERRVELNAKLGSPSFDLVANGGVDLGESRFSDLKLDFRLDRPSVILPNLSGRDVRATLALDGKFGTPVVDYRVQAAALGFGDTVVQGLSAAGKARVDTDRILIPVSAQARAITGLNATAGALLTNVRIDGDLAVKGTRVLSDNLRIRSDRLAGTAVVVADTATGLYTGAIQGTLNGYRLESVGIFNLTTDVDLRYQPSGYALVGTVKARSTRLFNDGVREQLGGNAVATARVFYGSDGVARFDRLRLTAPLLTVTDGAGRYLPNGQIIFNAQARSKTYGPLQVAVTGTPTEPLVRLKATNPNVGIGLAGLDATVRGTSRGYVISATGQTDYGPVSADLTVVTGRGPLTFDISRARFAGIDFAGRVSQTAAGPYAGSLTANGSGLAGTVQLANAGGRQQAAIRATANNYSAPGRFAVSVGRALVDARVTLGEPLQAVGDVQVADLTYNTLDIAAARAKFDVVGGRGRVHALAEGNSGVPFRVAANGEIGPTLSRLALTGRANGIDFRTAAPARVVREAGNFRLLPTRVNFSQGSARIAGLYGDGLQLQTRLDKLDLALLNSFSPGLGIGGTASGSLDFAQAANGSFPTADTRLQIRNFTRTSLSARSKAVDLNVIGRLASSGGDAAAVIRRNGALIGRAKVQLSPTSGAGDWTTRLAEGSLGGGIRYNGPADVLFSLAALSGQSVSGPIGVAADFSGRVSAPQLTGLVRANNLVYRNEAFGTRLTDMAVDGRFTASTFQLNRLTAKAGDGTVNASGQINLAAESGFPARINAVLDNAQLARGSPITTRATGELSFINTSGEGSTISGTLRLPETRYRVIRTKVAEVPVLTGVRRPVPVPIPNARRRVTGDRPLPQAGSDFFPIKLDIAVVAENELYVTGMGLESEWSTNLKVTGTALNPRLVGEVELIRGTYSFSSRRFELTQGRIRFTGSSPIEPELRIAASTDIEGVTVNLNVSGAAYSPQIAFTSSPSLPQEEVISRILFGSSVTNLSPFQAVQLAAALNSLRGSGGGLDPIGKIQSVAGIDRLRILSPDATTGRGQALAAGQYITKDIYIEIITDARGFTATQLDIALSKALSVISSFGSFGGSNVNVQYRKEY